MATPDLSTLLEDPSGEIELEVVPATRQYQTSNIIIQDKTKDGLLSFLSENTRYGTTENSQNTSPGGGSPSNTNGY